MAFHSGELKYTIGRLDQIPYDGKKQIVMCGRSNVGKSSLINSLLARKKLARVSSVPGKTITINMYIADNEFYLTDLPGYGFAKRPLCEKQEWSKLVDGYFGLVSQKKIGAAAVIQLIDMKVGPTADDVDMLSYLRYCEIPYFVVATKSDKLNKTESIAAMEIIRACEFIGKEITVIPFSALKNQGIGEVWTEINKYL